MSDSQRTNGFRGGIQSGTVACDEMARSLDASCKSLQNILKEEYKDHITVQRKLYSDQIPGGLAGCEPDGGAWFIDNKLVAIFEGKKQGVRGNAIERWYKNNFICRKINPSVCYITFAVGEGAQEGEVIHKTLSPAHEKFDVFVPNGNSCFLRKNGFTEDEMLCIMREVLNHCLEEYHGKSCDK